MLKRPPPKPRRPSLRPLRPLPLLLLLLPLLLFLPLYYHRPPIKRPVPPSHPNPTQPKHPPHPQDHCLLLGANPLNPSLWSAGSRALCLSSNLCLPTHPTHHIYRLANRPVTCNILTPDFNTPNFQPALQQRLQTEFGSCHAFQRKHVMCAYGMHYRLNRAVCPLEHVVWSGDDVGRNGVREEEEGTWLPGVGNFSSGENETRVEWVRWAEEEVVVVVPEYPYQRNIFHFSNVVPWLAVVLDALDALLAEWARATGGEIGDDGGGVWSGGEKRVEVLVRGRRDGNEWQRGLWETVWNGWVKRGGWNVSVRWMGEEGGEGVVCGKRVVMLGQYGDINAWPFVNGTAVREGGWQVPVAAVRLKEAVYGQCGVVGGGIWEEEEEGRVMKGVPLVVGYARRMGREALEDEGGGSLSGNVKEGSTDRVFTAEDEAWFGDMLKREVEGRGVELREFMTVPSESFAQQVRRVAGVGLVVGIHGANLVNGLWVRPWGGLVEVFPYGASSRCYWGGMNGGLAYWSWEAGESFEGFECDERKLECRLELRNRNVYLGKEGDREGVRKMVAEAVEWLKKVHGGGRGVRVRREGDVYVRQP